jgi:hypothetical protein
LGTDFLLGNKPTGCKYQKGFINENWGPAVKYCVDNPAANDSRYGTENQNSQLTADVHWNGPPLVDGRRAHRSLDYDIMRSDNYPELKRIIKSQIPGPAKKSQYFQWD